VSRRRSKITAISLFTGILMAGSIAFAAWTATGSGSGYVKATSADDLTTVDVSATTVAQLYPGGTGDVKVRIANPNPYPVLVTAVEGSGAITSDMGAACDAATGVTFDDQTGLSITVAANGETPVTFADAASMSNASDTTCQDAVFTIPVTLTGRSDA
jgi:hypothetical protein